MTHASGTIERVAELLPPDERERLLRVALRCRNLPDDDELLLLLEAIGIMSLLWQRIPKEIHGILEASQPQSPNSDYVCERIRAAVRESIPTFDDLRSLSQTIQQQQLALKRLLSTAGNTPKVSLIGVFAAGFISAILLAWISGLLHLP